jgi:hypothetical protein
MIIVSIELKRNVQLLLRSCILVEKFRMYAVAEVLLLIKSIINLRTGCTGDLLT